MNNLTCLIIILIAAFVLVSRPAKSASDPVCTDERCTFVLDIADTPPADNPPPIETQEIEAAAMGLIVSSERQRVIVVQGPLRRWLGRCAARAQQRRSARLARRAYRLSRR